MSLKGEIEKVKSLAHNIYGDASFAPHLIFRPEHHYQKYDGQRHHCLYHDMHTGNWWWEVQVCTNVVIIITYVKIIL